MQKVLGKLSVPRPFEVEFEACHGILIGIPTKKYSAGLDQHYIPRNPKSKN
jgi:hypothetical protein